MDQNEEKTIDETLDEIKSLPKSYFLRKGIKSVTRWSVHFAVVAAVSSLVPAENRRQKLQRLVASHTIGGMVAQKAADWAGKEFDDHLETFEKFQGMLLGGADKVAEKVGDKIEDAIFENKPDGFFGEVVLKTHADAFKLRDALQDLMDQYSLVTVADFYDLVKLPPTIGDNRWGWSELGDMPITRTRVGYLLELPKPTPLTRNKTTIEEDPDAPNRNEE